MELQQTKIEDLKPHPLNVNEHTERSIRAIAQSLKRFGQRRPAVTNADGVLLSGHGMVEAAKSLGWTEVTVLVVNDRDGDQLRWMVTDNRTAQLSRWKPTMLREVCEKIGPQTGLFTADELNAIDRSKPLVRAEGEGKRTGSWMKRRAKPTDTVPALLGVIEMRLASVTAVKFGEIVKSAAKKQDKPTRVVAQEMVEAWINSL